MYALKFSDNAAGFNTIQQLRKVLLIIFFFFKKKVMLRKHEENTHDTLFDGQKLNC